MDKLISEQAAIEIVEFECGKWSGLARTIVKAIEQLPPAEPQRTGYWISVFDEDEDKCSECQATFFCALTRFDFCPNCGADMRKGKQDE